MNNNMARARRNRMELLERRCLLAATVQLLSDGTLQVTGDDTAEVGVIWSGGGEARLWISGQRHAFPFASVSRLSANLGGGADHFEVHETFNRPAILNGGPGNDVLFGGPDRDTLEGADGNDWLIDPIGRGNVVRGGACNDTMITGAGNDTLEGGDGTDMIDYFWRDEPFEFRFRYHQFPLTPNAELGTATSGFETDTFHPTTEIIGGTSHNDVFTVQPGQVAGTEFPGVYTLFARGGDDHFDVSAEDAAVIAHGEAGNDSFLIDELGRETVFGGAGNDTILPRNTRSLRNFFGGPGHDTLDLFRAIGRQLYDLRDVPDVEDVRRARAHVIGNELPNRIEQEAHVNSGLEFQGLGGHDTLIGGDGPDTLDGGEGDDWLRGGAHHDVLVGGSGTDLLDGGAGADRFEGGGGFDTVDYSARTANLRLTIDNTANDGQVDFDGSAEASGEGPAADDIRADVEAILGGSGNDFIVGNPFANFLWGGAGDDTIWGGAGNDTLAGGTGRDLMFGQDGDDLFWARDGAIDTLVGGNGSDRAQRDNSGSVVDQVMSIETFI